MKLVILCFLISVCSAFDFDCLKGPDFWCKDFSNAEKCGKITECFMENKIIKKNIISKKAPKSGLYCSLCLEIGEVLIKNLETQQQFIDFINKEVCENLQSEIQTVCKLLVSQYGPLVYDKFKADLNPQSICKLLKFCDSKSILSREQIHNFPKINSIDVCAKCKEFFQLIQSVLAKITPQEITFFLDNFLCAQLPSEFQSTCKMLVDAYASQLYELIKSLLDGDRICSLIHLCPSNVRQPLLGSWSCNTCVDVVTVVRKDLVNVSESDLENFVKSTVCAKLNFIERSACNSYVSSLVPTFYKDIHSSATPQQICSKDKLCQSPKPFPINNSKKIKGIECEACRMAVGHIKAFISDPTNQNTIKNILKNKICQIFQSEKTKCQQFVDEYFSIIINFLISELDVDKICHLMNLCSSKITNIECSVCEAVMNKVIGIVLSNHTEQVIAAFVTTKICPSLGHVKDECVSLVNTYLPFLFNMARSTLNAKFICVELKLCTVITKEEVMYALRNIRNGSISCEICTFVVNETKALLTNSAVQNAIKNLIKNYLCKYMPNPTNCINDIDQYFTIVINVILEFLNPALCSELHLCSSPSSFSKMRQPLITLINSKKHTDCNLCTKVYEYLQSITGRKYRSNGVMGLISLCNKMNRRDKLKCLKEFRNLSAIIKSFNKSTCLNQFCTLTNMCSEGDRIPRERLGENSCSWGPAFWCISRRHAFGCGQGAVKHCETKVWNQMPRKL